MVLHIKAKQKMNGPGQDNTDPVDSIQFSTAVSDGQVAVEQRLRNLIELAIAIGRRDGLIGTVKANQIPTPEGGQDVTNQRNQ
jgi:hypothetical protein